ncbi:helix-turn-helix transcriptional regulator [Blastochloris sulfoviridis]|uniref:Helix-turn-helix transcriptional regulator n=2 Tax=Blastochloris sulfoviridis TaxID=50712 RepID=A0A5M6I1Z0_9HYPH|nr:helix-turn-helix transcriptional regulator [Blastochloris sulfoviridis]KAA5601828.1 helix-turn-helix transcriptional regulator [Blastochloris sulfoviridis]
MDIRDVFGKNLLRLRKQAGLSQEGVADLAGVDRAHIGAMERGEQNVTLLTLWQVAHALHVRPADLLNEDLAAGSDSSAPDGSSSS